MRKLLWLVLIWLLWGGCGFAQDVKIGDRLLMRLENDAQARAVESRIEALLQEDADPAGLHLDKGKNGVSLLWGQTLLVVVSKELAEANKSNPEALARLWLDRLKDIAEIGMLKIRPGKLELPITGESSLEVSGLAEGPFFFQETTGRVQLFEEPGGKLRVVAKAVGKTKVTIQRGHSKAYLYVHVKDWAGYPPEQIQLKVTGNPAPSDMVLDGSLRALSSQSRVNPGCNLILGKKLDSLPSVPTGGSLRFKIPIRIEGNEDYYPVVREIPVLVQSITLEPVESNLLLVSNRPEQIDQDGILLDYTVSSKEPSRLMYSHMNASREPRNLWVNLSNPGDSNVEVVVDWTYAGPSIKEVQVGHMAAGRFLSRLQQNTGFSLIIPPHGTVELASHRLAYKELLSGFANLRLIQGEKLQVQVLNKVVPGRNDGKKLAHLGAPFNPFKIHPHGIFAQPYFEEWLEYSTGQPAISMPYGESPWLIDFESGLPNTGNFGVLYRWHVTLSNKTSRSSHIGLSLTPQNGPAAGSIWVNGQLYQTPFRGKGQEAPVAAFTLAPRQELTVDLVTFPEASSSYPAVLSIRELKAGESFSPPLPVKEGTEL